MEEERNDGSTSSASTDSGSRVLASSKIKQEEIKDTTLKYERNLEKVLNQHTKRYEALSKECQIRYDDMFDKHVQDLVDFHRKFGHWKVPARGYYKGLHQWLKLIQHTYKDAYFRGKRSLALQLSRHRFEKLLKIGYPFQNIAQEMAASKDDDSSTRSVDSIFKFKQKDGEDDAGTAFDYQRNLDKALDQFDKRYERLSKARQKVHDSKFNKHYEDLFRFHREYGHWKVPATKTKLYRWQLNLHEIYRCAYYDGECCDTRSTLPRHRLAKLVSLGYPFEEIVIQEANHEEDDDESSTISSTYYSTNENSSIQIKEEDKEYEECQEDQTLKYQRNLEKVLDEYTERYEAQSMECQIRYEKKFDKHVQDLVDFHRKFGHWDVQPQDDRILYNWLQTIHNICKEAYFRGNQSGGLLLPRHRYEKLASIGYPLKLIGQNEHKEDSEMCNRKLNKALDHSTKKYENLSQRKQKKWDDLFDSKLKYLVGFHRKFGHWKVPRDEDEHIWRWLYGINLFYKNAFYKGHLGNINLPRHRYEKLVAIGYPFEKITRETTFCDNSTKTRDSPSSTASSDIKIEEQDKDTHSSSTEEYKRNLDDVLNKYTERHEQLSEKCQKRLNKKFEEMLERLLCFYREFRHWNVPTDDTILYPWLNKIRHIYRCAYYDGKLLTDYPAFPRYRYEKLVAIGYPFEEIIQVIPSLSMPQDSHIRRSKRNMENEQKVAASIRIIEEKEKDILTERRIEYKRNLDKVISSYTESFEKLSEKRRKIYNEKFNVNFQRLVEFQSKFGNFKVPKAREEYKQLYNWVYSIQRTFRRAYVHGMDNECFKLTRDRYNRLVAVGFPFKELEGDKKDSTRLQSKKHSSTIEENSKGQRRSEARDKPTIQHRLIIPSNRKAATGTKKTCRKRKQTNTSREEIQALKSKILQLERENESHYDTIYRLKDEKEALVDQVEKQEKQLNMLNRNKRLHRSGNDYAESTSSSSKRQCTCSSEIERLQQERQLLIDQLRASTENYRKLLDLLPRSESK